MGQKVIVPAISSSFPSSCSLSCRDDFKFCSPSNKPAPLVRGFKKFCYQQKGYIGLDNPRTFKGIF